MTLKRILVLSPALLASAALLIQSAASSRAADRSWSGGTGTYNNPASWTGGVVPGAGDTAINDSGTNNRVQLNAGDPDWAVGQLRAGTGSGSGAFEQNGQTLTLSGTPRALRLGYDAAGLGVYTLNSGTLNYGSGEFNVGQLGRGILNVHGGSILGNGTLAVNVGTTLDAVNATMDGGTNKQGHTWFERGFYAPDPSRGMPAAGSTVISETQPDHSYTMPPSYAGNSSVMLGGGLDSATVTLTAPTAASALSFLGSAGGGSATINYTVHFSGAPDETGSFVLPDWYPPAEATVAVRVGGRVLANGLQFQNVDGGIDNPKLVSVDIAITNTTSQITSIDLTRASGGIAGLMAISSSSGGSFNPLAITGYNADLTLEAGAPIYVASAVTNFFNQTAGSLDLNGEFWVGNVGAGVYNLSGGTNFFRNWFALGRSGGYGTMTMTGGELIKTNNGNFMIGTGYQATNGATPTGVLNHSGGTIYSSGEFMIPENAPANGTYNLSGTASLTVNNWMQVGRFGGTGLMNMTGGTVTKIGGGNFIVGDNATGVLNHSGGTISVNNEMWVGQSGSGVGTYNLSGTGILNLNSWTAIGRAGGNGTFSMTGGTINKTGGGVFIIGDNSAFSATQTAGAITANELWVANGGNSFGTYDLSGTGSVTVNGYVVIGRDGQGTMNMSGGTLTKTGDAGSHLIIASGGSGNLNQMGGDVVSTTSETWIAENGNATWTMSGGTATLSGVRLARWTPGVGTLNLNGGTMTVNEILGGDGTATVNFNGGTLVAGADGNFIHDLDAANVDAGGVIINTAGHNVTIGSGLLNTGGGGLTKNGAGTLVLNGTNTYIGATTVNAGKVATSTASTGAGDFTVAGGAGLGVLVASDNGQLAAASVTLSGSASTLDMDLTAFGSPAAAPLAIVGALSVNGTVTVNILASGALQVGTYPLITCGSRAGAGTLVLGALPLNTLATLLDNGTTVSLNITDVNAPRWEGLAGGNWDISLTTNWINGGSGLPTYFSEGSEALFNDEALGTTSVNLVATVHPTTVTFNNTNLVYTLAGSGKISGSTGLNKQGPGVVAIHNTGGNDYTGPTVISAGVVSVTNLANAGSPSPIGKGNLVLAGGALSYAGPAAAISRGYAVQTGGGTIETLGNLTLSGLVTAAPSSGFTKTGPAQLAYTGVGANALSTANYLVRDGSVAFDGSAGAQTNTVQSTFSVAGAVNAVATLTNTTLTVNDNAVGNVAGSFGSMTVNNGTTLNVNSWLTLGDAANSVATLTLNGGTVNVPNGMLFLGSAPGTMTTLNINGGVINQGGNNIRITDGGWNGTGARTGTVNQVSGTINCNGEFMIGQWGPSMGIYNLSGGEINQHNWMQIGRESGSGIFTMTGGTLNKDGNGHFIVADGQSGGNVSHGEFHMTGGTFNNSKELWVGQWGGVGVFNMTNGSLNVHDWVCIGRDSGNGTFNMAGGTFTKDNNGDFLVAAGNGSIGVLNHSGGTIISAKPFLVPQWGNDTTLGTYNLSGTGVCSVSDWVAVGRDGGVGVFNLSGGSFTKSGGGAFIIGASGRGTFNHTAGTLTNIANDTWIGENNTGVWTMSGGSAVLGWVQFARNGSGVGTLNLDGGVFSATELVGGGGLGTNNMNGGTIKARANNANFMHDLDAANVLAGGVTFDTDTNTIGIAQALLDGTGGGGLTKIGTGTLNLNGVNTYTGPTVVNAGALGGSGVISGSVTVNAGGAIAPGTSVGTLSVNNDVTLGGTALMEVSKTGGVATSDLLLVSGSLAFGGTLKVVIAGSDALVFNDTFNLFDWGTRSGAFTSLDLPAAYLWDTSQLNVNGTIRVIGVVPAQVSGSKVVGGNFVFTGIGGPPGGTYSVLTSTNAAAPQAEWTTNRTGVFDSNAAFSNAIPVNAGEPARFFRMKTP